MSSKTAVALGFLAVFLSVEAFGASNPTVINPASAYPEGPVLVGDTVYYAEMGADRVVAWNGVENRIVWTGQGCGPTSVARGGEGTLLVLCHKRGSLVRISVDGSTLAVIDRDSNGERFSNPNASVNDAHGGVYFSSSGDFSPFAPARGAVFYFAADGSLRKLAGGIHYANGIALSADGATLFVSEHLGRRVLAYDVTAPGQLAGPRVFLKLDDVLPQDPARPWEAGPDGLATDIDGNLYIAEYGGGRLLIVDRNAALLADVPFPERYTTAPLLIEGGRRILMTAPVSLMDDRAPGKVYVLENPAWSEDRPPD